MERIIIATGIGVCFALTYLMLYNVRKFVERQRIKERARVISVYDGNIKRISSPRDYNGDRISDFVVLFENKKSKLYLSKGYEEIDVSEKVYWTGIDTAEILGNKEGETK